MRKIQCKMFWVLWEPMPQENVFSFGDVKQKNSEPIFHEKLTIFEKQSQL